MSTDLKITGRSKHVLRLREDVVRLTGSRNDVLAVGEPGVGKTTIALLIAGRDHVVTCDLARENEAELSSLLEGINKGTVVLEGLEEAGYRVQDEISRFLSRRPHGLRVIATLCQAPTDLLNERKLQDNLCNELVSFERIDIQPLRQRPEDIPLLVKHFAEGLVIDINTLETLVKLPWKENIRQLRSVVERCISSAENGRFVLPEELVDERTEVAKIVGDLMESQRPVLDSSLDLIENSIIRRTLERFGFNESKSAEFLGMTEHVFGQKLRRLALARTR